MSDTPNQFISLPRRSRGFSLVELMVAITLGLLLTAGMIQLFNSSKVTFRTNDAVARVQENGRFALEMLKIQLREAGTLGFCAGQVPIRNHLNTGCAGGSDDFSTPISPLLAGNTRAPDAARILPSRTTSTRARPAPATGIPRPTAPRCPVN